MIQSYLTDVCGAYCVDFIRHFASGGSLKSYVKLFTADVEANDVRVVDRLISFSSLPQLMSLSSEKKRAERIKVLKPKFTEV